MAQRTASRWPTATGLWLAVPAWVYAVLAVVELRDLDHDPTDTEPWNIEVAGYAPPLVWATALGLGTAMLLGAASWLTGRLRRTADLLLGLGMVLGAAMLWAVAAPRPVAPWVVGVAGVLLVASALLPPPGEPGRAAAWLARLLLATVAALSAWVVLHQLSQYFFQWRSWTVGYWAALGLCLALLVAAVLGERLTRPVPRWLFGLPLLGLGLLALVGGVAGLDEGYLVSGFEENEDGWRLGGAAVFTGAGWTAAGLALLRRRWLFAVATTGLTVVLVLGLVFGIREVRLGW